MLHQSAAANRRGLTQVLGPMSTNFAIIDAAKKHGQTLAIIPLCAVLLTILGCPKAYSSAAENRSERDMYVVVHFNGNQPPGHGIVVHGNIVNFVEKINDIRDIEYQVDNHKCRIENGDIVKIARADSRGKMIIPLGDCK